MAADLPSFVIMGQTYAIQDLQQPAVFEQVFDAWSPKIYRYALLHTRSKEDAEDILSATFLRLWNHVSVVSGPKTVVSSMGALLYRIARNLVIDQYRTRKPTLSTDELLEQGIEFPEIKIIDSNVKAELALVLDKMSVLSQEERDLILLRFIEGMAVQDIAAAYDITENNASVRIHRAMARLKEIVNKPVI